MRHLLTLSAALVLASASAQTAACPKIGGTATIAQNSEPGNLNPLIFPTTYDTNIEELVFNALVKPTADLDYQADLAQSWTFSADKKTITFKLQPGVKWHDGQALTAKDVAFTLTAIASPKYNGGAFSQVEVITGANAYHDGKAKSISGIKVIDDRTIAVTTDKVYAPILATMAGIMILPQHIYGKIPVENWQKDATNRNPVGSGPFKFKQFRSGELIELEANKNYFAGRPCLDRLIVRFGDANTMLAALVKGEVDAAPVPVPSVASVKSSPNVKLSVVDQLNFDYVGTNLRNPLLADQAVRNAMAYAINRKAIVSGLMSGYGNVVDTLFPKSHWAYPTNVKPIPYDPALAQKTLDDAGWKMSGGVRSKGGKTLKFRMFYTTGNPVRERGAALIQANLRQIGIQVDLQSMDFPTLVTFLLPKDGKGQPRAVTTSDFDLFILGFGIERDPSEYLSYFTADGQPPNGYNFSGYTNPAGGNLLVKGQETVNQATRKSLYNQFGLMMRDQLPWIPLTQAQALYGNQTRLHNFAPDIRGVNVNVTRWWVQ
ncbi:ABC transporter substrate-binding protein [Deinococcus marmoris]|uniref:Oligopeptide ABC transporter, periplasmic oligopeptide-binding protein OppA n=1 Tax=Deinococcus marmoris TaxID=249408 RepID=A0A1U7NVJ7_9DEIO|nr:ABC transporter substrate-binding protein [Deinococcus marmoris]OLV16927.1 Oligopeptide ABC transporter, periplasmic oligopeptide-binding protein OppA [Deinococcus marmoris]